MQFGLRYLALHEALLCLFGKAYYIKIEHVVFLFKVRTITRQTIDQPESRAALKKGHVLTDVASEVRQPTEGFRPLSKPDEDRGHSKVQNQ